jgi:hypothetical protein
MRYKMSAVGAKAFATTRQGCFEHRLLPAAKAET